MSPKSKGLHEPTAAFLDDRAVVDDSDNPIWTEEDFANARPASELPDEVLEAFANKRMRGKQKAPRKQAVSIRLSPEVIAYFKAGGPGWQTRIDDVLRAATGAKRDD